MLARARARPPAIALRVVSLAGREQQAEEHVQLVVGEPRRVFVVELRVHDDREHVVGRVARASRRSARARTPTCRTRPARVRCRSPARKSKPGSTAAKSSWRSSSAMPIRKQIICSGSSAATSTRKSTGSPSGTASRSAPVRRRSSPSRLRNVSGVRPLLTSRRIRPWRGSSIMLSTIPATGQVLEERAAVGAVAAGLRRVADGFPAARAAPRRRWRPTRSPRRRACARWARATTPAPRRGGARTASCGKPCGEVVEIGEVDPVHDHGR